MGTYVKWIVLIILLAFFITFGVENSQIVNLSYYGLAPVALPLYTLCYVSILIGILVGMGIGFRSRFLLKRRVRDLERGEGVMDRITGGESENNS